MKWTRNKELNRYESDYLTENGKPKFIVKKDGYNDWSVEIYELSINGEYTGTTYSHETRAKTLKQFKLNFDEKVDPEKATGNSKNGQREEAVFYFLDGTESYERI